MKSHILIATILVAGMSACNFSDTKQDDDPGQGGPNSGDGQAAPGGGATVPDAYAKLQADLFNKTCARCHNPGRSAAGVDLTTYAPVKQNAARALQEIQAGAMPPSGEAIDATLTSALACWIERGAPEQGAGDCFPQAPGAGTSPGTGPSTATGTGSGTGTGTATGTTGTCEGEDHPHDDDDDCHQHRGGDDQ